jgi:RimJ/RimL family protein N-acetyltransferase
MLPEVITTERLVLRPPRLDDAAPIFEAYANDPEATRYLMWQPYRAAVDLEDFLLDCVDAWREGQRFPWVLEQAVDDHLVGMIELRLDDHRSDVGYVVARRYWGRGYASEALRAVIRAAFAVPRVFRVAAACEVSNRASARVMEKAGMTREGLLRRYSVFPNLGADPRDVLLYAIVK